MFAHLWSSEIDEFLAHVLASHLVATGELQRHVEVFQQESVGKKTLDALCEHLVRHRALTQWQCDQLREGKYRGFFLDDYRITEFLRTDETRDKYLAEEAKMDANRKSQQLDQARKDLTMKPKSCSLST